MLLAVIFAISASAQSIATFSERAQYITNSFPSTAAGLNPPENGYSIQTQLWGSESLYMKGLDSQAKTLLLSALPQLTDPSPNTDDSAFNLMAAVDVLERWSSHFQPSGSPTPNYTCSTSNPLLPQNSNDLPTAFYCALTNSTSWNSASTSNQLLMAATARFLASQMYPNATFASSYATGDPTGQIYLLCVANQFETHNIQEYDSDVYTGAYFASFRAAADFSQNSEIKSAATMAYDWLLINAASTWLNSTWAATSYRRYFDIAPQNQMEIGSWMLWPLFSGPLPANSTNLAYMEYSLQTIATCNCVSGLVSEDSTNAMLAATYGSSYVPITAYTPRQEIMDLISWPGYASSYTFEARSMAPSSPTYQDMQTSYITPNYALFSETDYQTTSGANIGDEPPTAVLSGVAWNPSLTNAPYESLFYAGAPRWQVDTTQTNPPANCPAETFDCALSNHSFGFGAHGQYFQNQNALVGVYDYSSSITTKEGIVYEPNQFYIYAPLCTNNLYPWNFSNGSIPNFPCTAATIPLAMITSETSTLGHLYLYYDNILISLWVSTPFTWDGLHELTFFDPTNVQLNPQEPYLASAMEVASPTDPRFAAATPAATLAKFQQYVDSNASFNISGLSNPPGFPSASYTPAVYTGSTRPVLTNVFEGPNSLNSTAVSYIGWPLMQTPWVQQTWNLSQSCTFCFAGSTQSPSGIGGGGNLTVTSPVTGNQLLYNFTNSTVTETISQTHPQTISFTALSSPVVYGVSPISLSATASSGLPVSFSVVSGPGTISGSTLTITGAGTIVVAANQAGNSTYLAAFPMQQTLVVSQATPAIDFIVPVISLLQQNPVLLTTSLASVGTGVYPTGTVTFYVQPSGGNQTTLAVVTLASGVATYTGTLPLGTDSLTATYSGDSNYVSVTSSAVAPVTDETQMQVQYVPAMTNVVGKAGTSGWSGDGGPASAAEINGAKDAVFDSYGNMYIVDQKNYVIRMVYAGGSTATNLLSALKVACSSGCTYPVPIAGYIYTIAGTHGTSANGTDGVLATATDLYLPYGIALDSNGNIYIADSSANRVRVIKASTGIISNFAGSAAGTAPATAADPALLLNGGAATSALLDYPVSLAIDSSNNVYIGDAKDCQVRVVPAGTTAGYLTGLTVGYIYAYAGVNTGTGSVCSYTATPAPSTTLATAAKLSSTYGIALDGSGNLYISDVGNYVIKVVSPTTGYITTVVGNHTEGTSGATNGNGGPATSAELVYVWKIAVDRLGNLVIADTNAQQVRYVNMSTTNTVNGYMQPGYIYTLADNGTAGDIPNLTAVTGAAISGEGSSTGVEGIAVDPSNNIYYVDYGNEVVRKINASATSPYVAASVGAAGTAQSFYADVTATGGDNITSFQTASGFGDFTSGTESGCTLGSSNAVGTVCIEPVTFKPIGPGLRTAPLTLTDSSGNKFTLGLSGIGSSPQLAFTPGTIATMAGNGSAGYTGDGGAASGATLNRPSGSVMDTAGNIYIADTGNNVVRMISAGTGIISTVAGTGPAGYTGDAGAATNATLHGPKAVALDAADNLYIADTDNNVIREVLAQTGIISTIVGTGTGLVTPSGVAVDLYGNVYISDTGNNAVRKLNALNGIISTVASVTDPTGLSYTPSAAAITGLTGIYSTPSGVLLVASPSGSIVKQINLATNAVTTVAGDGTSGYAGNGSLATSAELSSPNNAVEDAAGNIYIADTGNSVLRRVDAYTGNISTIAGTGTAGYTGNGGAATSAELNSPAGIALDASANVYLVDSSADVLRKISLVGAGNGTLGFGNQAINTTSASQTLAVTNTGNLALTFTALTVPTYFAQLTGNSTDCSSTTSLATGQSCYLRLTFTPTSTGNISETLSLTSNTLNVAGTASTATLTGTGVE